MPLTTVTLQSKNKLGPLPGYVTSGSQKMGLVVIQEWWGANDQIKKLTETWFPDFVSIVPDLYRGLLNETLFFSNVIYILIQSRSSHFRFGLNTYIYVLSKSTNSIYNLYYNRKDRYGS